MRQHPGIAARDIDIRIPLFQQTVQYVVEGDINVGVALQLFSADKLDLVEKDIIPLPFIRHTRFQILRENERVTVFGVQRVVERKRNDTVGCDTRPQQVLPIEREQQKGLAAPADARDDFDEPVVFFCDQTVQIRFAINIHSHLDRKFCIS